SLAPRALRLERQCANALAIAGAVRGLPGVRGVRHPGLSEDPSHALAARQMRRFGGVLTIDLGDRASATRPPPPPSSPPPAPPPTPPASAASTRRPSAGPGGAATRSPRA